VGFQVKRRARAVVAELGAVEGDDGVAEAGLKIEALAATVPGRRRVWRGTVGCICVGCVSAGRILRARIEGRSLALRSCATVGLAHAGPIALSLAGAQRHDGGEENGSERDEIRATTHGEPYSAPPKGRHWPPKRPVSPGSTRRVVRYAEIGSGARFAR
jgi:hypothetical protein